MRDLEDCQLKLESLFDQHFLPNRDFTDLIADKKDRCFEENKPPQKRLADADELLDAQDQDSQPMDLD